MDTAPAPFAPIGQSVGGYRISRVLAEGDGVETFLAEASDGTPVVVKVADTEVSPAARLRLQHEATVIGQLDSAHLTPLVAHGWQDGRLYLVTPYVPDLSLAELLRLRTLTAAETVTVGRNVARALQAAHDHGVLHRDVKPANVIVEMADTAEASLRDRPRVAGAVLVDFGLARSAMLAPDLREVPVGSIRYMAPEQAGLLRAPVDERADLYALGLTLFESLTGTPLCPGQTVTELLRQQMTLSPPPLRDLGIAAPRALETIVQRLLRKDPPERYQSAEGLAKDLDDLAAALAAGIAEPRIALGTRDRRIVLAEPAFVGRHAEIAALAARVENARDGHGGLVLLEGDSGGGKTRLLDELRSRVSGDVLVLSGQGVDQAAQRPFEVLTGVVDDLVATAERDDVIRGRVRGALGGQRDAAAVAFPELASVLDVEPGAQVGPEEFAEQRTVRALGALLDGLGDAGRPGLVLLDDCQWADELSLKLLEHWQRTTTGTDDSRHVLVVAAFRSEEVRAGHTLRQIEPMASVKLGGLGPDDTRDVARSMTGGLPDEAADIVIRLAEGSPFMASAAVRGLVESGALVADGDLGWRLEEAALDDVHFSRKAAAFLAHRIELLPEQARRLLAVGAVLGKDFELALAGRLAGMSVVEASRVMQDARRRHMLWVDDTAQRCTFVHDKLRETVLARLDEADRRDLHRRAAEALVTDDPVPVFELAFHLDAAGDHRAALPYALAAAEQARAQQALQVAEQQYRIAERGAVDAGSGTERRVAEELGQVLMLRGQYDGAGAQFERALALTADPVTEARILGELGELAFKRGDVAESSVWLEQALQRLGQRAPHTKVGFLVNALWEVFVQVLHSVLPRVFVGRRPLEDADADLVAARIYSRLAHSYWFGRGSVPTLFVHLREMNIAERYPDTPERAQAYSEHAPVMTLLPWYGRGVAYARRSLAIRRGLGDVWGEGQSLHFYGAVLYAASRFEECLDVCREAVRLLERTGDRWEVNTARWHIAYCLYRSGDLTGAVEVARDVHRSGEEIGDAQARGIGLAAWSKASGGRVPADLVAAELRAIGEDVHTSAEVLQAEACRLLGEGRPSDAVATLERADQMVRAKGLRQEYVAPVLPWLLTALRRLREETPRYDAPQHRRLLRRSRAVGRRARRMARSYRNNAPHTLRELAYLHAELGHDRRARRLLRRSLAVAEEHGAAFEQARTRLACGEIGMSRQWADAADELQSAEAEMQRLQVEEPDRSASVALIDRFDVLLDAGRRIASSLDASDVIREVRSAALALLRAEECLVIRVQPESDAVPGDGEGCFDLEVVAGERGAPYSEALVATAVSRGHPVVIAEGVSDDLSDSVVLSGARSVLCAPIFVRDEIEACLYVSHHALGALFGEEEERIAAFVAALAGGALENAAGFAEVQELSRTLEQRVQERTVELVDANLRLDASVAELQGAYEREVDITAQLRQVNQLKTDMMAMAAHDLRTPLTVLSGYAAMLRTRWEDLDEADRGRMLERMVANTKRLIDFVENLLQFGRIESGELQCDLEPFDLAALIRRTVAEAGTVSTDVQICTDIPGNLPVVLGDEQRQWQVLTNLLNNAAKFSPEGEPVLVVVRPWNDMVRVSVEDRGPGIPQHETHRLFEKFARLDGPERAKRPVGTGLGLYICRSIVEAHGGTISCETSEGAGCTFSYTIPTVTR